MVHDPMKNSDNMEDKHKDDPYLSNRKWIVRLMTNKETMTYMDMFLMNQYFQQMNQ